MATTETTMIEKGFTKPTARVKRLKKVMVEAMPVVGVEQAVLVIEATKKLKTLHRFFPAPR